MPYKLNGITGKLDYYEEADLSAYALLNGTNQPFTGNIEIKKATPEFRLTYDDANDYYTRFFRQSSNISYLKSQVEVPARANGALYFDGTSNRSVTVADNNMVAFGTGVFTVSFICNTTSNTSRYMAPVGAYDGAGMVIIYRGSDHRWVYGIGGSGGQNGDVNYAINDGEWHLIQMRRTSATNLEFWIDGVLRDTATLLATNMLQTEDFQIGASSALAGREWLGDIDEVAIWGRSLADTDMTDLYNSGDFLYVQIGETFPTSGTLIETNIVAVYHLDEGTGTVANDSSGNDNHGVLIANPVWTTGALVTVTAVQEVDVLKIENGLGDGEQGTITLGNTTANTVIKGGVLELNGSELLNNGNRLLVANNGNVGFLPYFVNSSEVDNSLLYYDSINGRILLNTTSIVATLGLVNTVPAQKLLYLKGAVGQTGDILSIQNSASADLFIVSASGDMSIPQGTLNVNNGIFVNSDASTNIGASGANALTGFIINPIEDEESLTFQVRETDALKIEYDGSDIILNLIGAKIGVDKAIPAYKLDVVGDINTSTNYRINGTLGFTGTGSYTNFTIVGGIITNAS